MHGAHVIYVYLPSGAFPQKEGEFGLAESLAAVDECRKGILGIAQEEVPDLGIDVEAVGLDGREGVLRPEHVKERAGFRRGGVLDGVGRLFVEETLRESPAKALVGVLAVVAELRERFFFRSYGRDMRRSVEGENFPHGIIDHEVYDADAAEDSAVLVVFEDVFVALAFGLVVELLSGVHRIDLLGQGVESPVFLDKEVEF